MVVSDDRRGRADGTVEGVTKVTAKGVFHPENSAGRPWRGRERVREQVTSLQGDMATMGEVGPLVRRRRLSESLAKGIFHPGRRRSKTEAEGEGS